MKIISRYILREHIGPFTFALTALTSLMLLNFISRQFGELVGKGLPGSVIGEFFLLSVPFTIALTVPMSVLVAVLYAFSRLASENEVTALKANGVSPWRLIAPAIASGVVMSILLLAFNDQVLPRANHRLKNLQDDISQAKPAFLLKEQVINPIVEGKLYLKAGKIINGPVSARLKEVVIYDLADTQRRRTIYADTARLAFAGNRVDLDLDLYSGEMQEVSTDKPSQLDRLFYEHYRIKVKDVGRDLKRTVSDPGSKGDREMSICLMQKRLWQAQGTYEVAKAEFESAKKHIENQTSLPPRVKTPEPHGLGWAYCTLLNKVVPEVKEAQAAEVSGAALHPVVDSDQEPVKQDTSTKKQDTSTKKQDTSTKKQDTSTKKQDTSAANAARKQDTIAKIPPAAAAVKPGFVPVTPGVMPPGVMPPGVMPPGTIVQQVPPNLVDTTKSQSQIAAEAAAMAMHGAKNLQGAAAAAAAGAAAEGASMEPRVMAATMQLTNAQRARDRFDIEINKKFSLAAACLIFCILAPPIALRFPRGGVGLVIGVSLAVFALYYVGLIGGEALANKGVVPPFWAMWGTNVILTLVGVVMLFRMGRDAGSGRGGGIREWLDERRLLREERRAAALANAT